MKAYLIPKNRRFDQIMIIEVQRPIPRVLAMSETGEDGEYVIPAAEFDLETRTDIAVYKEREYVAAWLS